MSTSKCLSTAPPANNTSPRAAQEILTINVFFPSRRRPTARNLDPLRQTAPLLALHVHDVRVASAPAPDTVLLLLVPVFPVVIFLEALLLVERRRFEIFFSRGLARGRVSGTVLDGGVPVAEVAEVVDVTWREQGAGGEGVDWSVAPLKLN